MEVFIVTVITVVVAGDGGVVRGMVDMDGGYWSIGGGSCVFSHFVK